MDDDTSVLEAAIAMLEFLGYEAAACTRGEEAVELYRLTGTLILALDQEVKLIVSSGYRTPPICKLLIKKSLRILHHGRDGERARGPVNPKTPFATEGTENS